MSTITDAQQQAIADILIGMTLPSGLGDRHNACSLAAINLALSGRLTDDIPDCMSSVVGRWIIDVQDDMPDKIRNSARWKELLPLAAGTGKLHEQQRLAIIFDWMWVDVLPTLQPVADSNGFGSQWLLMASEKSYEAADAAAKAAAAREAVASAAWARAVAAASVAAASAAWAAWEDVAVWAAGAAAAVASAVADAEARAAWEDARDAKEDAVASAAVASAVAWDRFDPCGLLQRLVEVSE